MVEGEWLFASLAILLGAHLVLLGYAALARWREVSARTDDADSSSDDDEVCLCARCGAENDPDYRFCRNCIAELPGHAPNGTPTGRRSHPN